MWEWLIGKILPALKSSVRKEYEGLFNEVKDQRDFFKREMLEMRAAHKEEIYKARETDAQELTRLSNKIREQNNVIQQMKGEIGVIREMEENCLDGQRIERENNRILLEKLIFKTKGKHWDDEI